MSESRPFFVDGLGTTLAMRSAMKAALLFVGCIGLVACGGEESGEPSGGTQGAGAGSTGPSMGPGTGGGGDGGSGVTHVPQPCPTGVGAVGVWENITPPELLDTSGQYNPADADHIVTSEFGIHAVFVHPKDPRLVFLGTDDLGLWRSEDCGATFAHVDTGTLGSDIDTGALILAFDPTDVDRVYTSSLYGPNGFFRSTDGGKNFTQILTPAIQEHAPYGGFVGGVVVDPSDARHLVVTWHGECAAPFHKACFAESFDGGDEWEMRNGLASWSGGEGTFMNLLTSNVWLFSSQTNGMWRSEDGGAEWKKLEGISVGHAGGQHHRLGNGKHLIGTGDGVAYTADEGVTWTLLSGSGVLSQGVTANTRAWSATAYPYGLGSHPAPFKPFRTAPLDDLENWTEFDSPLATSGAATMAFDADHKILYSASYWSGVFRVVVE